MAYDPSEAKTILARAHAAGTPHDYSERRATALRELRDTVANVARDAGYDTAMDRGALAITHRRRGTAFLLVEDDGIRIGRMSDQNNQVTVDNLAIEFDPVEGAYVGTEEDTFYNQVPGKSRKRRSAVAVVAEVVVSMIEAEHAARMAAARR